MSRNDIAQQLPKLMTFHIVLIGYSALIFRKQLIREGATTDIDAFYDGEDGQQMIQEVAKALGYDDEVELHLFFELNPEILERVKQLVRFHQDEDLIQRIEGIKAMRPLGEGRTPWA